MLTYYLKQLWCRYTPFLGIKLFLLGSFFVLLFISLRLAERVNGWQDPVQPSTLSIRVLKEILEQRGISHLSGMEKSDLVEMVEKSGHLSKDGEAYFLTSEKGKKMATVSHLNRSQEFRQQVELSKNGIWLVMVIADDKKDAKYEQSLLSQKSWLDLQHRLSHLDIRMGVFRCRKDRSFCENRKWRTSTFHLFVPRAFSEVSDSHVYKGSFRTQELCTWMLEILQGGMIQISTPNWLEYKWLTFRSAQQWPDMHVVALMNQNQLPPFLLALSGQLKDLARFAWVRVKPGKENLLTWTSKANISANNLTFPVILIANSEGVYVFGQTSAECYTYTCLRTFLEFFKPSQNTAVNVSFSLAILLGLLEVVIYKTRLMERVVAQTVINCSIVVLIWLFVDYVRTYSIIAVIHRAFRYLAITGLGALIRGDVVICVRNYVTFFLSLAVAILAMKKLAPMLTGHVREEDYTGFSRESSQQSDREQSGSGEPEEQQRWNTVRLLPAYTMPRRMPPRLDIESSNIRHMQLTRQAEERLLAYLREMMSLSAHDGPHHDSADLPVWYFSTETDVPEGFRSESVCVICQYELNAGDKMTGLPCEHIFHHDCLFKWLNEGASNVCPICRQ